MVPSSFFTDDMPIHVYLKSDSLLHLSSLSGASLGFICFKNSLSLSRVSCMIFLPDSSFSRFRIARTLSRIRSVSGLSAEDFCFFVLTDNLWWLSRGIHILYHTPLKSANLLDFLEHILYSPSSGVFFILSQKPKNSLFFIQILEVNRSIFIYLNNKSVFFKKVLTWGVFSLYYASSFLHQPVGKIHCSFT